MRGEDETGSGENEKKRRGRRDGWKERKRSGRKGERIVLEMEKLREFEARE